jgi:hypothetical protein
MRYIYMAVLAALLLLPVAEARAQKHLGVYTDLLVPITPFSNGYSTGYGVGFMFRRFEMTRSFIFDATFGFQSISIKDNPDYLINGQPSETNIEHRNLRSLPRKLGFAWAFIPNSSPLTQPFAGFDVGYNYAGTYSGGGAVIFAPRIGWMLYPKERFLLSAELKYNTQVHLNERFNGEFTKVAGLIDHQLTLQFSATFRVGR